jgi:hypothetical protein
MPWSTRLEPNEEVLVQEDVQLRVVGLFELRM